MKENGYDPKVRFSIHYSDWDKAASNPELISLFIKVFGEDYESDMILDNAKKSKNVDELDIVLTEYFTRLGVIRSRNAVLSSFFDNEAELFIKVKLLRGLKEQAFQYTYDLIMAELRGSGSSSMLLVQNLMHWQRDYSLSEIYAKISETNVSRNSASTRNICHIGMNYLFNKNFDSKQALNSFRVFKDFVETEACISPTNRDIFKTILNVMLREKPSEEEFSTLFNREYDNVVYPKYKFRLLFAIAFYISGDTLNGELFLREAMVSDKNPETILNTNFEDFFLLLVTDSMINELNEGAA